MTKYFLDTEFAEGFHKPFLGKRRHFIDLISIGITCEDGREYYAISNEFDERKASPWVRENVLAKLEPRIKKIHPGNGEPWTMNWYLEEHELYKSNKQIADEIYRFVTPPSGYFSPGTKPEFIGYFSGFDYVLLSSMFGTMDNWPSGFPMYIRDLKQIMDEKQLDKAWTEKYCPKDELMEHNALADARWIKAAYRTIFDVETGERPLRKSPVPIRGVSLPPKAAPLM